MLSTLLGLVLGFFAELLTKWLSDLRKDQAHRDAGAAGAKADIADATIRQTTEIRDAEDRNRARSRSELADRLRRYSPGPKPGPNG